MSYPKPKIPVLEQYSEYNSKLRSLKLTPTQRKKLLNSHRQEEIKTMILNKYLEKRRLNPLQIKNHPQLQSLISSFVQNEKLTEKNLAFLFDKLQSKMDVPPQKVDHQLPKDPAPMNPLIEANQDSQPQPQKYGLNFESHSLDNLLHEEDSETDRKSLYKANELESENEWAMIVKYRQKMYEEDLKKSQLMEKQKKELFKTELDKQLALKRQINQQNSNKNEILELKIQDFRRHQELLLAEKQSKRQKLLEKEQKAQDDLFKEINNRIRNERKIEAEIDRSLVNRAREELFQEQEKQRKNKLDYQNTLRKIMAENELNRIKVSETDNQLEKISEMKALTEENEILERKETMRMIKEEAFNESKTKELIKSQVTSKAIQDRLERLRLEELNQLKYQTEIEKKEQRKEEMRRKIKEEQMALLRSSLEHQMREKESSKKIEEELNKKQAEFWRKDIQEYHLEEERKKQKIREENMKTLEIVKKQIDESGRKKELQKAMDEIELLQNKAILKDISKEDLGIKKTVITMKKHI